jgi:hypothetical protein
LGFGVGNSGPGEDGREEIGLEFVDVKEEFGSSSASTESLRMLPSLSLTSSNSELSGFGDGASMRTFFCFLHVISRTVSQSINQEMNGKRKIEDLPFCENR